MTTATKKQPEVPPQQETQNPDTPLATTFAYQPLMQVGNTAGLKGLAEVMKPKIASMLPKHITAERMLKALFVAASKTPKLLECSQESIVKSLMDASSLGLDCSGTLGSAYLVPFKNKKKDPATGRETWITECQLIPGYRGLIDLARRGGQVALIEAHAVYAQDEFDIEYGTVNKIYHKPYLGADRREEFTGFYAVATFRDGTKQPEFMTVADVIKIKNQSKAGKFGPWVDHFSEMARKTVVRRLCKYLPLSPELEKALEIDNDAFDVNTVDVSEIDTSASRTDDLAGRLGRSDGPQEVIDQETGEVVEEPETTDETQEPGKDANNELFGKDQK